MRTIEENIKLATGSTSKPKVSNTPLCPSIPLSRAAVDNLHMFVCVGDVLIDLTITELRTIDKVEESGLPIISCEIRAASEKLRNQRIFFLEW